MITRIIDKFAGNLTRDNIGALDSGLAKYPTSFGYDPLSNIGNLTWLENPIQIDPNASVITDLIMAQKTRIEIGITYVYAIGHTGRLYKIQVNNNSTLDPNYDTAVLLTTLTVNSPTFRYGSSIQFYGSTERMYIGHDLGITRVNFDGTGETFIGTLSSYFVNVPRPSVNFLGVMYWGNGSNILAIDSTETVTTYTKLSPGFPTGTYIRDLDISTNGVYLEIIVTRVNQVIIPDSTPDTTAMFPTDSYKFAWNGIDPGYTSYSTFTGYSQTSNTTFGPYNYTMGYDLGGAAIYKGGSKLISLPNATSPIFSSMFSTGNMLGLATTEEVSNTLKASIMFYGQYDRELPNSFYRFLRMSATSPETDILRVVSCLIVSNLSYGSSSSGYPNNQLGAAKIYFSTVETSSAPTLKYRFYKFTTVPTGLGNVISGVYETQQETSVRLFRNILKKKLKISEVRVYCQPLVANNSFKIDIIGNDGNPISGSSFTFTVGTNLTAGTDIAQYNPPMPPQHSVGVRITNLGTKNWVVEKIELDIDEEGKL